MQMGKCMIVSIPITHRQEISISLPEQGSIVGFREQNGSLLLDCLVEGTSQEMTELRFRLVKEEEEIEIGDNETPIYVGSQRIKGTMYHLVQIREWDEVPF